MVAYTIRRVLQMIPVVIGVAYARRTIPVRLALGVAALAFAGAVTTVVVGPYEVPLVVTGEPLYWKVPMPGRLPSGKPANEDPARTKPKARIRLSARMVLSPDSCPAMRRRRCDADNHGRFRA